MKQKTVYQTLDGKEIEVNDGNTFVNICPISARVIIEGIQETPVDTTTSNNVSN